MKLRLLLLGLFLFACSGSVVEPPKVSEPLIASSHSVYLPLVTIPYKKPIVGVETYHWNCTSLFSGGIQKIAMNYNRVPFIGGIYDFSYYDPQICPNSNFLYLSLRNFIGEPECKFPLWHEFDEWLAWALATIEHFDPKFVSFWNEFDTSSQAAPYYYGCIGDDYASGVLYGQYFVRFQQAVKSQFPQVKVLAGEMMNVYNHSTAGMFSAIGDYDGISFHHYARCRTDYYLDVPNNVNHLRQFTDKPLYLSETSVIYDGEEQLACEVDKANYVEWCSNQPELVETCIFFCLNNCGWKNCWLEGRPAYDTYVEVINRR